MSVEAIRNSLIYAYGECDTGITTNFGNAPLHVPRIGIPWANLFIIPNMPEGYELGQGGSDYHTGIMQIDLYYPAAQGDRQILQMCDKIRNYFVHGKSVVYEGQAVSFARSGGRGARNEDGEYKESITINWSAKVNRVGV